MKTETKERIVYSNGLSLVNIVDYDNCIFHAIYTGRETRFTYNDRQFVMKANDIAVIAQPGNAANLIISATSDSTAGIISENLPAKTVCQFR